MHFEKVKFKHQDEEKKKVEKASKYDPLSPERMKMSHSVPKNLKMTQDEEFIYR